MLYTSYISNKSIPEYMTKIAIVRKPINSKGIFHNVELSPEWDLLNDFKQNKITHMEFAERLINQFKNDSNAMATLSYLKECSFTQDIVLLCYCGDMNNCHRILVARLLQQSGALYGGEI